MTRYALAGLALASLILAAASTEFAYVLLSGCLLSQIGLAGVLFVPLGQHLITPATSPARASTYNPHTHVLLQTVAAMVYTPVSAHSAVPTSLSSSSCLLLSLPASLSHCHGTGCQGW